MYFGENKRGVVLAFLASDHWAGRDSVLGFVQPSVCGTIDGTVKTAVQPTWVGDSEDVRYCS